MKPEAAVSATGSSPPVGLRDIVRRHRVCYEVWPEFLLVHGRKTQVGFALELYGTNEHSGADEAPGCPACHQTHEELKQVAAWITPKDQRPTRHEVEPFDGAWHAAPSRHLEPQVVLRLNLLHRHGFDQPVDECERRCLGEMLAALERLGVGKGRYRESAQEMAP